MTNGGQVSPLLAPVEFCENSGVFDKSHTTVDLDKITKIGVLTQISSNNSVNKIMFYEDDRITYIASACGWSVAEPNLNNTTKLKSNKFYTYKEHLKPANMHIVGFHYAVGLYGKNETLVDFRPLFWQL